MLNTGQYWSPYSPDRILGGEVDDDIPDRILSGEVDDIPDRILSGEVDDDICARRDAGLVDQRVSLATPALK